MGKALYGALEVTVTDQIAVVALDRVDALNAVNDVLHHDLAHVFSDLARMDDVRVVVLTGNGKAFCSGGDLKWLGGLDSETFARTIPESRRIVLDLLTLPQPIIAAVNGPAVGLGATLALYCDMVVMGQSSTIADVHVAAGLTAGDGGAAVWPLLVGMARAKEFLLTSRTVTADEAQRLGLASRVVADDDVRSEALKMAKELAAGPQLAIRTTKAAMNKLLIESVNLVLDLSLAWEEQTFEHPDHKEAVSAFIEHRKPKFA